MTAPLRSLLIVSVMSAVTPICPCSHSSVCSLSNCFWSTCHALGTVGRQGHAGGQGGDCSCMELSVLGSIINSKTVQTVGKLQLG